MVAQVSVDGAGARAWRLRRHALEPRAEGLAAGVAQIADRVVAFRAWPHESADQVVRVRQATPVVDDLDDALARGDVLRSYALRGGSYVLTPSVAQAMLICRGATRVWESRRYQAQGDFEIEDWQPLRAAVREILADGPATRQEIGDVLRRSAMLRHFADAADGRGSDSLYKPLHWWGDICFGPDRSGVSTFRLVRDEPGWPGELPLQEAGRRAVRDYLAGYAPATLTNLTYWFTEGLSVPRRMLAGWLDALGEEVVEVTVDGVEALVLARDLGAMRAAEPSSSVVCLLPAFDPWVFGPGTADARIISPGRRGLASRGANLVIRDGVVCGTWAQRAGERAVAWFEEER